MKKYFQYINMWAVVLYIMLVIQIYSGFVTDNGFWSTLYSCFLVWALFMCGYNAKDRELEIDLNRALENIEHG